MSITPEDAMTIISQYYGIQEDLKRLRKLKESIIEDLENDLPEFRTEAEHDRVARIVDEQILTFSDTTMSVTEHDIVGSELLWKLQHQRIDDKRAWNEFLQKWYLYVESN